MVLLWLQVDRMSGGQPALGPGPLRPHLSRLPSSCRFILPTLSLRLRLWGLWRSDLLRPLCPGFLTDTARPL